MTWDSHPWDTTAWDVTEPQEAVPSTDWLGDLRIYLPLEQVETIEIEYIQTLTNGFDANQNKYNEVALLLLHQIFMFCAYGMVYSILKDEKIVIKHAFTLSALRKEDKQQLQQIDSPFTFSLLNESTFFEALALVDVDAKTNMRPLKELVKSRNELAHCNGKLSLNFSDDVRKYIDGFENIHDKFKTAFTSILLKVNGFDFKASKELQTEQLRTFLGQHYFTQRMLNISFADARVQGLQKNAINLINNYISDH